MPEVPHSFSLFELNEHLKRVIAFNMQGAIWINCEIADVNSSKGTVYLSLVERDDYQIKARADAMIWSRDLEKVSKKIGDSIWSILQVGRQVLLSVKVELHEYHGVKLIVKDIDPTVTIGQLELKRMKILKQLEVEQFTNLNAQLSLAPVLQRIAVISSSSAAGLQDFLQQLETNPYQYKFQCKLFPAAVQGANVGQEIIQQIEKIEQQKNQFDCIVIVRGGGARLDLMGFDDYDLCVAIATCELPVFTGIGHDIDETLADLVAYAPLKTPTAVADFLIHRNLTFESTLMEYAAYVKETTLRRLKTADANLDSMQQQIRIAVSNRFRVAQKELEHVEEKLSLLNPQNVLNRGFVAMADSEGKLINSTTQIEEGASYTLYLPDGKVEVTLTQLKKNGN